MATLERHTLLEPLRLVSGVIERRQTLPILGNVLFAVADGKLMMTATDSEIQLSVTVPTSSTENLNPVTASGRNLLDIVANLEEKVPIGIEKKENKLKLKSGRGHFSLATLPAAEFPLMERDKFDLSFSLPQGMLKRLLEKTYFAMANQDARYFLNGLLLDIAPGKLTAVSTDGHRLALASASQDQCKQARKVILPRKSVIELIRLLQDTNEVSAKISLNRTAVNVETDKFAFTSKLIDGQFPDYERVIPKNNNKIIELNTDQFNRALMRVSILSHQKGVRLIFGDNSLSLHAYNENDNEEATEEISINYTDAPLELSFNSGYLKDIVAHTVKQQHETLRVALSNAESSALFEPLPEDDSLYLVMPMRL